MPSFCYLQYEKLEEGLEGFITGCMPLLTSLKLRLSFVSPRIHVVAIASALSMLASTAEKATRCVQSFCLVMSSYENNIVGVGTSAAHITQ